MPKYRVKYEKWSKSESDVTMDVEADSPQAAYERVRQIQMGEVDPTEAEETSEEWSDKEYLVDSGFNGMSDPTEEGAVREVITVSSNSRAIFRTEELRDCSAEFAAKAP